MTKLTESVFFSPWTLFSLKNKSFVPLRLCVSFIFRITKIIKKGKKIMAGYLVSDARKVTTHRLMEMKEKGEKISMLTSYDFTTARIVDEAGMDVILVGDSASNVMAGNATTLPITVDQMIYHARSVVRGVNRALVVVDMPFGSYQADPFDGVRNAMRMMKETGADALKLEGGEEVIEVIGKIIGAGVPVMGHLGLMPQSIAIRRSRMLCLGIGKDSGCIGKTSDRIVAHSGYRYWCWRGY